MKAMAAALIAPALAGALACASDAPVRAGMGAAAQGGTAAGGPATGGAGAPGQGDASTAGRASPAGSGGVESGRGGAGGPAGTPGTADAGMAGAAGASQVDCPDALPLTAGMKTETLNVNGDARSYLVVVPASVDARVRVPVVLGFHGGNGTSEYAQQTYGLDGDEPALYVYPQAISWPEAGGVAWNVDAAAHDLRYFDALLADLGEKYCIDESRVFAAGQSNGGFFVNALGCYRPDALRAIASVAGGGPPGQCTGSVAAMIIHGTADTTVTIDKGMFSREYWLAANGCAGAASMPADSAPCVAYAGCAEPVLWCEHDGGHPWPDFAGSAIRGFFLEL